MKVNFHLFSRPGESASAVLHDELINCRHCERRNPSRGQIKRFYNEFLLHNERCALVPFMVTVRPSRILRYVCICLPHIPKFVRTFRIPWASPRWFWCSMLDARRWLGLRCQRWWFHWHSWRNPLPYILASPLLNLDLLRSPPTPTLTLIAVSFSPSLHSPPFPLLSPLLLLLLLLGSPLKIQEFSLFSPGAAAHSARVNTDHSKASIFVYFSGLILQLSKKIKKKNLWSRWHSRTTLSCHSGLYLHGLPYSYAGPDAVRQRAEESQFSWVAWCSRWWGQQWRVVAACEQYKCVRVYINTHTHIVHEWQNERKGSGKRGSHILSEREGTRVRDVNVDMCAEWGVCAFVSMIT